MDEARVNRARFRAWRRGFREADLILGPFADSRVSGMSEAEMALFEDLLDQPDHDVYDWITGAAPAPARFDGELIRALRAIRPSDLPIGDLT